METTTSAAATRGAEETTRTRTGRELAGRWVTFRLAGGDYGIEVRAVREIIGATEITRVPCAPDFVEGVINLRGKVIPVIDLRARFGMPRGERGDHSVIIIAEYAAGDADVTMGVLVDEVMEVRDLREDCIEPPPRLGSGDAEFLLGVGRSESTVVFLLDAARVLDAKASARLPEAETAAIAPAAPATGDAGGDGGAEEPAGAGDAP